MICRALFAALLLSLTFAAQADEKPFVVHEWGVMIRDGRQSHGGLVPMSGALPRFVLNHKTSYTPKRVDHGWDKPVLHFYGTPGLQVEVQVGVGQGQLLAYWPRPQMIEKKRWITDRAKMMVYTLTEAVGMKWTGTLTEQPKVELLGVSTKHWWSLARGIPGLYFNGDASSERFLFYEATARQVPPVTASVTRVGLTLVNKGTRDSGPVLLIVNDAGKHFVKRVTQVAAGASRTVTRAEVLRTPVSADALLTTCREQWRQFGMTDKEAQTIVEVWRKDLVNRFGFLLISRMSRPLYDQMFPITIKPAPAKLVRVGLVVDALVGQADRADWLSGLPALLARHGRELGSTRFATREAAFRQLARLSDLARPMLLRLRNAKDLEVRRRARELLELLGK